jgi:uncharacterized protein YoxC
VALPAESVTGVVGADAFTVGFDVIDVFDTATGVAVDVEIRASVADETGPAIVATLLKDVGGSFEVVDSVTTNDSEEAVNTVSFTENLDRDTFRLRGTVEARRPDIVQPIERSVELGVDAAEFPRIPQPEPVEPVIESLSITGIPQQVDTEFTAVLGVEGTLSDGSTESVGGNADFTTRDPTILAVSDSGRTAALNPGTARLRASVDTPEGTVTTATQVSVVPPDAPEPTPEPTPEPEPEPPSDRVIALEFTDFETPLTVGEDAPLDTVAIRQDGSEDTDPLGVQFSSRDRSIASIRNNLSVVAGGQGSVVIEATLSTEQEVLTATRTLVVERDIDPVAAPGQPPEPNTVRFPFSIFNAIPGITGSEDFVVRIPTVDDITGIVRSNVVSQSAIQSAVDAGVSTLDIPDTLSEFNVRQAVRDVLDDVNVPSVVDVRTGVREELDQIEIPEPPTVDEITDPLDETLSGVQSDLEAVIDDAQSGIDDVAETLDSAIQESIDGVQETVDSVSADIDSLSEDFDSAITDVQETADSIDETVPSLSDIVADVTESVIDEIEAEIIPEAEGVLLTEDVPLFLTITIEDFLSQALSAETKQRLQEQG